MRPRTAIPILVAFLAIAGCSGDEGAPHLTAAVDTVDGIPRISYPAEPAGPLGWSLDTVAILGDAFAEDVYQFDQVSTGGLASDLDGNLYVLDRQGGRVLKYGPDGRHRATFGRKGEGPGELSQPISLAVGPGDTAWVSDFSNSRLTGYPRDGGDPRTIPLPGEGVIPGERLAALEGGFITLMRPLFGLSRGSGGRMQVARPGQEDGEDAGPPVLPVMRLTPSLEPTDTLWASPEPPMDMVQLEAAGRIMVTMMSREYHPEFQWAGFPDGGIVVSDSAAYVLHVLDADGRRVRTIVRDPPPRSTTDADRELARERVREQSAGGIRIGGSGPDEETRNRMLEQRLEKMTFADVIPRVVELRTDPADRIWVGVSEDTPDEVDRIDVYRRDGTLLGEIRDFPMPDVFLGPDRIGVLRRDELDVQQVVVLEIERTETEVAG